MNTLRAWETAPDNYTRFFQDKCARVEAEFDGLEMPPSERFSSPPASYRARAEFRIWHTGERLDYVMFDPANPREPVPIEDFAPAIAPIRQLMPALRDALEARPALRRKLFQAEFMASASGEVLLTLVYHRALDDHWEQAAQALAAEFTLSIVGRSRKQKRLIGRDYITDSFNVGGRVYRYRQYEQSFAQPNAPVNEMMLNWIWQRAEDARGDLLELYCGNGNFTLPLADRYEKVIATELAKSGVRAAQENLRDNAVANVDVVRLSAEEVSQAMAGVREFRRLATLPQTLSAYNLRSVFVDPPRAGLDPATLACVRQFERIYYVSCNPETLRKNLQALGTTHAVDALAFFDQFPYSAHLECAVVLNRRGAETHAGP